PRRPPGGGKRPADAVRARGDYTGGDDPGARARPRAAAARATGPAARSGGGRRRAAAHLPPAAADRRAATAADVHHGRALALLRAAGRGAGPGSATDAEGPVADALGGGRERGVRPPRRILHRPVLAGRPGVDGHLQAPHFAPDP